MRSGPLLLAALVLAGCNQAEPGKASPSPAPSAPATVATTNATVEPAPGVTAKPAASENAIAEASTCGADKAKAFVGRQDRPTTRADLIKLVGHDRIRWLGPDDAMTTDYSEGRLNVLLDAQKRTITGVRCG